LGRRRIAARARRAPDPTPDILVDNDLFDNGDGPPPSSPARGLSVGRYPLD
jgi:hypothetical protein